jgi:purine-binding chemotaxis protein CheW
VIEHALAPDATLGDAVAAADAQLGGAAMAAVAVAAEAERFVVLSLASTDYAVPESCVTEIERVPATTAVPGTPAWLSGVTNLRGDILSVIDLRAFAGLDGRSPVMARMLVARLPDDDFMAGLIVDGVDRIVAIPHDAIRPPAAPLDGPLVAYVRGVCAIGERLVAVLDLDRLLRSPDIRQFDEPVDRSEKD